MLRMASSGKVPEEKWLLWDTMGWHGGWGTTYAFNLCLYVKDMSEEQWVAMALTKQSRPPMPWFTLREMKDADLRAIYRFLRVLGPAGEPAPAYLPPGGPHLDRRPASRFSRRRSEKAGGGSRLIGKRKGAQSGALFIRGEADLTWPGARCRWP